MAQASYLRVGAARRGGKGGAFQRSAPWALAFVALAAAVACVVALTSGRGGGSGVTHCDVLFVGYDAGETLAFLQVLPSLGGAVRAGALVMATAEAVVERDGVPGGVPVVRAAAVGFEVDAAGPRNQTVSAAHAARAAARVCPRAQLVVTGAVSSAQLALADAYRARGARVAAYVDAFEWAGPGSYFARFATRADEAAVATSDDRDGMRAAALPADLPVAVVGNPTTDAWADEARDVANRTALRESLAGGGLGGRALVAYAGGYGRSYESAFRLFAAACVGLAREYQFVVSLHPKVNGSVERAVLAEEGAEGAVAVAPKSVDTARVAYAADLVTSFDSTVGVQSLFIGRPSVFVAPPPLAGGPSRNLAVEKGLSPLVGTAGAYAAALNASRAAGFAFDTSRLLTAAGLPEHPTVAFVDWVLRRTVAS